MVEERFQKEFRTKKCENLMKPEVRFLLDLPLDVKETISKSIIRDAFRTFKNVGIGFSGGTDSVVILHLAKEIIKDDTPVVFANTRFQFQETYKYIKEIIEEFGVKNYKEFMSETDKFEEFKAQHGFMTPEFTALCCEYHKIKPMLKAVEDTGMDALITGIRGLEHEERAQEIVFSPRDPPKFPKHVRVHPILFWTQQDVLDYVKKKGIKCNPLYAEGYTSLGCTHCTSKNTDPDAHERAGRGAVRETIMKRLRDLGYS
ncbi:MAG: phosphoadenosine phosphosulfate reductase family protein [Nanoarchaeota archaeon]|nr:phosphoadenosine phosphosulfate reductase family protein [Nanoarchaeota archaeon]